jgi:hypothetical protein
MGDILEASVDWTNKNGAVSDRQYLKVNYIFMSASAHILCPEPQKQEIMHLTIA